VSRKKIKKFINKKNPQNGGTGGIKLMRQKVTDHVSLQELVYHGKNPNARKKCGSGYKN